MINMIIILEYSIEADILKRVSEEFNNPDLLQCTSTPGVVEIPLQELPQGPADDEDKHTVIYENSSYALEKKEDNFVCANDVKKFENNYMCMSAGGRSHAK